MQTPAILFAHTIAGRLGAPQFLTCSGAPFFQIPAETKQGKLGLHDLLAHSKDSWSPFLP